MVTPLAFDTAIPFRGVLSCSAAADGHGCAALSVAAVDDHLVAVESADVQVRGLESRRPCSGHCLVFSLIDPGVDQQDPVAGQGGVDGALHGLVVGPARTRQRRGRGGAAVADEQHARCPAGGRRRGVRVAGLGAGSLIDRLGRGRLARRRRAGRRVQIHRASR